MSTARSTNVTLWVNRIIALMLLILIFTLPALLEWYMTIRDMGRHVPIAIAVAFYCCLPAVLYAQWCMERLLRNIRAEQIFVQDNVRYVRRVRWCCLAVSLICIPAAFFYPPLIFMVVIMGFLALVVSVAKNILAGAVELREENDLTI